MYNTTGYKNVVTEESESGTEAEPGGGIEEQINQQLLVFGSKALRTAHDRNALKSLGNAKTINSLELGRKIDAVRFALAPGRNINWRQTITAEEPSSAFVSR